MDNWKDIRKELAHRINFFENNITELKKRIPNRGEFFDLYMGATPGTCVVTDMSIREFLKWNKINKAEYVDELRKIQELQNDFKDFFRQYKTEIVDILIQEMENDISGYSSDVEKIMSDDDPWEWDIDPYQSDMLFGRIDAIHYLLEYFIEAGIEATSFKEKIDRLDSLMKDKMEKVVERFPEDQSYDHSRPIDYTHWWLFMDRIVAEEKKRKTSLVSTNDEKSS